MTRSNFPAGRRHARPSFAKLYLRHIVEQRRGRTAGHAEGSPFGISHRKALTMNRIWGRRWMLAGALVVTAGVAGLGGAAVAENGQMLHVMHGMPGHGDMMSSDPAAMAAHLDKMIATMVPDATPEQKAKLLAIAKSVHADFGAVHAQFGQAHKRAHEILLQPVVDRAALETLRVEQMQQIDVVSKRIVTALADAAEVMTPEQRVRFGEQMQMQMQMH
jgi:Spy/CpxP family protein refolding chaperone